MVTRCVRCGRRLKTEPWAEMGVGRVCAGYLGIRLEGAVNEKEEKYTPVAIRGVGAFDVMLERDANGYATANVHHTIVHHSPAGFEWGYGGSGPAELALNILSAMIGQEAAQTNGLYQRFKWDFIVHMPKEGGTIKEEDIQRWLTQNGV